MILLSSYNRPEMLMNVVKELHGKDDIVIIDDGSTFPAEPFLDYGKFYRFRHKGRDGYWIQYQYMMEIAQESDHQWFMFIQDDISQVQYEEIKRICDDLPEPYAFNFMRRGGDRRWTNTIWSELEFAGVQGYRMGYVDCNFCVPRSTLDLLEFKMNHVSHRWLQNPFHSSGVGKQLSERFYEKKITMYMPKKSLAFHGNHKSEMHYRERSKNPLVSI